MFKFFKKQQHHQNSRDNRNPKIDIREMRNIREQKDENSPRMDRRDRRNGSAQRDGGGPSDRNNQRDSREQRNYDKTRDAGGPGGQRGEPRESRDGKWHKEFFNKMHQDPHFHQRHRFFDHHKEYPHIHYYYDRNDPIISLSIAEPGEYQFITTLCGHEMAHRLLEMGFIPQTEIKVISNTGENGTVMIEIKGSKLALNHKIANDIIIQPKK